jgi:hypothetical protein
VLLEQINTAHIAPSLSFQIEAPDSAADVRKPERRIGGDDALEGVPGRSA